MTLTWPSVIESELNVRILNTTELSWSSMEVEVKHITVAN